MTSTTRRQVLSGAAAACAALLTANPRAARASAPIATQQNAGFYRFKVGDIEVTILHDGARTFPYSDSFVKNATREEALAAADEVAELAAMPILDPRSPREIMDDLNAL